MYVRLAKTGQRRANQPYESCDNCVGQQINGSPVPVSTEPSIGVHRYNVLVPGLGTQQFWLHRSCADYLASDQPLVWQKS